MGVRYSNGCVFIFHVVSSFSFCLLQTFVIRGNYLIEKKKNITGRTYILVKWCKKNIGTKFWPKDLIFFLVTLDILLGLEINPKAIFQFECKQYGTATYS